MDGHASNSGEAGSSARREAERKRAKRLGEQAQRGPINRVVAALFGPTAEQKRAVALEHRWETGAGGEELLADFLAKRCPDAWLLHDRRVPHSRANIDHIAVTASGVYVIDTKRYTGKIVVNKPIFGDAKLTIKGRDRTSLIVKLDRQVEVVRDVLSDSAPQAPVHGCLCFVAPEGLLADTGLPAFRRLSMGGYQLYSLRRLAKQLQGPGSIAADEAEALHASLGRALAPA
jgi:hypothetical protein